MRLRDEITEFCHVLFSQWLPPFFSQFFIEYPCLSKLKHWSSQHIWKSLVLHIYFSSCPESLGHPTRFQDCISLCIKAELTVLTTYPANLSVLSVGWFRGFGGWFGLMYYIHFLIRKLSSQAGFHLDGLKYLIPDLVFNIVFPDCNLSGWLCWMIQAEYTCSAPKCCVYISVCQIISVRC